MQFVRKHFAISCGYDLAYDQPAFKMAVWHDPHATLGMIKYRWMISIHWQWPPPKEWYMRPGLDIWSDVGSSAPRYDSSAWTGRDIETPVLHRIAWRHWRPRVWISKAP